MIQTRAFPQREILTSSRSTNVKQIKWRKSAHAIAIIACDGAVNFVGVERTCDCRGARSGHGADFRPRRADDQKCDLKSDRIAQDRWRKSLILLESQSTAVFGEGGSVVRRSTTTRRLTSPRSNASRKAA